MSVLARALDTVARFFRTLFGLPFLFFHMCCCATVIIFGGESELSENALRHWSRTVLRVSGARVQAVHRVALDRAKSYVFVCNHTSNLDAPAVIAFTRIPVRFIAKRELTLVPFFGLAASRMGHVFVDRKDRHAATRAIRGRIERGLSGVALFFFAEGTRSTTETMLPFKKGAAIAALEAGLEVVPVAIAGAREVQPKGIALLKPGPVALVFGAPIPLDGFTLENRDALVAVQRAAVEELLTQARALVAQGASSPDATGAASV